MQLQHKQQKRRFSDIWFNALITGGCSTFQTLPESWKFRKRSKCTYASCDFPFDEDDKWPESMTCIGRWLPATSPCCRGGGGWYCKLDDTVRVQRIASCSVGVTCQAMSKVVGHIKMEFGSARWCHLNHMWVGYIGERSISRSH